MSSTERIPFNEYVEKSNKDPEKYSDFLENADFYEDLIEEAIYYGEKEFKTTQPLCNEALMSDEACDLHIKYSPEEGKVEWKCDKCRRNGAITDFNDAEFGSPFENFSSHGVIEIPEKNILLEFPEDLFRWFVKAPLNLPEDFQQIVFESASYANGNFYWEAMFYVVQSLNGVLEMETENMKGKDAENLKQLKEVISNHSMKWLNQMLMSYTAGKLTRENLYEYLAEVPHAEMMIKEFDQMSENLRKEAENEGLSVEEFIESMQHLQDEVFDQELQQNPAYGGLSNHQYLNLIYNEWIEQTPGLVLNTDKADVKELENTPVIRNVRLFSKLLLQNNEKFQLTKEAQNLKQKDVTYLLEEGVWSPGWVEEVKELNKTINELDAFEIHEYRVILTLAKIFRKQKGELVLMKKNKKLLERGSTNKLYATLLETWFRHYNFAYSGGDMQALEELQVNVPFYLYRLSELPERGSLSDLAKEFKFSVTPYEFADENSDQRRRAALIYQNLIRPLYHFGMMEIVRPQDQSLVSYSSYEYKRTELFDKIIHFSL